MVGVPRRGEEAYTGWYTGVYIPGWYIGGDTGIYHPGYIGGYTGIYHSGIYRVLHTQHASLRVPVLHTQHASLRAPHYCTLLTKRH